MGSGEASLGRCSQASPQPPVSSLQPPPQEAMVAVAAAMGAASLGADGEAEAELVVLLLVVQLPREQQADLGEGYRLEVRVAGSR